MKFWITLAVALSTLPAAVAAPKLAYTFTANNGQLHVELRLHHAAPELDLELPTAWGDAVDLHRAITNLHALEGTLTKTADPGVSKLHTANGRAHIAYDLVQDWTGALRESVRHRPHVDATHFEIAAANALVRPRFDLAQPVVCTFDWRLPAGWTLATSFGTAPRQTFRGPWNDVVNALFAAGDFRIARSRIGRGTLVIAVRGKLGFPDAEAHDKITRLIRLERDFWRDYRFPYFLVTLSPYGPGQSGAGGGGFTNAFNLFTAAEGPFSTGLLSLLAHETFHTWNPLKMGRIRSPEENTNWFTEGFTTYYQDLLLWQAGLLPDAEYIDAVNRLIRDYHFSPARHVALSELIARKRQDPTLGRVPYDRGAMIALLLDHEIRRRSGGHSSLDTLMRELFAERNRHPDLSKERIFAAIGRHVDAPVLDTVRAHVETGSSVDAPPGMRVPCAARVIVPMPEFELGLDRGALLETRRVQGLKPGSAAEKSGIKNGDAITGLSVYWNDVNRPVRLTLQGGRKIEYLPHGPTRQIPQYRCP